MSHPQSVDHVSSTFSCFSTRLWSHQNNRSIPPFDPSSAAYDDDADPDINMTLDPSSSAVKQESPPISTFDGANDAPTQNGDVGGPSAEASIEAKLPMQKDISLQEFLGKMDDYAPIVHISLS